MTVSPLLCDPAEKARLENENAVDQLDFISHLVTEYGATDLRNSHVLELHRESWGGQYRTARNHVGIANSPHEVPEPALVPSLVNDAVNWINAARERPPLERAAYALWRFNWIHAFRGGNGRTSRALAYLIVCMAEGTMLPGVRVMPDLIYDRRDDYIAALREVDASERDYPGAPDFDAMTAFLRDILTKQLATVIDRLSGNPGDG